MEPIIIKTSIYKINYKLTVRELTYNKDSFFKRMIKRLFFRKIKKEIAKIAGTPEFEPLIITIKDEVNLYEWISDVQKCCDYKKDLVVKDINGDKFILHGCFPVEIYLDGTRARIIYDYFTTSK